MGIPVEAPMPKGTSTQGRLASVDLRHLRFVVTAVEQASFRKAAELLSVRQSTLSRPIRQVEHSIGATVFKRSSGGVRPTLVGHRVVRMARTILEELEALIVISRVNYSGEVGRLAIGFCTSLSARNLGQIIDEPIEKSSGAHVNPSASTMNFVFA